MRTFHNNVIIITGAGSGLGALMARQLLQRGAAVGAIDVAEEGLDQLRVEAATSRLHTVVGDVTDRAALAVAVRAIEQALGPCDRLIANAGIGCATPADNFSSADFEKVVRANLIGVANSVEAVLPGMMSRRRGHLVAISSLASFRGLPVIAAYCAAKAGVNALFDSLRVELKPHGIRTTTICPGWIRTPLTATLEGRIRNMIDPEEAVDRILQAVEKQCPFVAFPFRMAWPLYLMRWLPVTLGDRMLGKQTEKLRKQ